MRPILDFGWWKGIDGNVSLTNDDISIALYDDILIDNIWHRDLYWIFVIGCLLVHCDIPLARHDISISLNVDILKDFNLHARQVFEFSN